MTKFWNKVLAGAIIMGVFACDEAGNETASTTVDSTSIEEVAEVKVEDNNLSKNGLTLTPMTDSPTFDESILELNTPNDGDNFEAGSVDFSYNVKNYQLGNQTEDAEQKMCANSAKGQHIHLILNNEPYSAHYEAEFARELEEGNYLALSFISRSYHESIKHPQAYVVRQFTVGGAEAESYDLNGEILFYSRPKGEYSGDDVKRVMLDFYLVNTDISEEGNKVRATINGTEFTITNWVPYVIEGLPMGENTIKLELIDNNGELVEAPFNPVERTFILSDLN